jgi:hypothetical protein
MSALSAVNLLPKINLDSVNFEASLRRLCFAFVTATRAANHTPQVPPKPVVTLAFS